VDKDKNPPKPGSETPQGETAAGGTAPPGGSFEPDAKPARSTPAHDQSVQDKAIQDKAIQEKAVQNKATEDKATQDKPVRDNPSQSSPAGGGAGHKASRSAEPVSGKPSAAPADKPAPDNKPAPGKVSAPPTAASTSSIDTGKPAAQAGARPRRGGKGKWIALLMLVVLAAGGYFLWPLYGDRVMALSGMVAGEGATRPQPPPAVSPPGDTGDEASGGEVAGEADSQAAENGLAAAPAIDELFGEERSARQDLEAELRDQMADLQLQLNSHADRLRQLSTTSRDDWLLAEAEYLLRLASQRLLTERQTANASALMESADVILRDMSDPALYPVRKALAEDITRVRMTEPVDREGIFLRIGALVDAVDTLDSLLPEPGAPVPVDVNPEPASWYGRLLANVRQAAANMVGLVRVERRDVPLQPLLTLEQEQVLRYNLKVVLEQARLALLREEQTIYADSLGRASDWIGEHFEDSARTAAFVTELEQLATLDVSQDLPSVTPSLQALQAYIRLWHNRHDPGAPPGSADPEQHGGESP